MATIVAPDYYTHLHTDKKLSRVLAGHKPFTLKKRKNICLRLCASIMSQQLSTKVADVIFKRFLALYDGKEPTPMQILETPLETLRSIGLSNAKAGYVRNVAQHAIVHGMSDKKLYAMTNEEVMTFLTPIKGVGKWTVEMLLMFTLGREDIFSPDDLGIQQAMIRIYKLEALDKKALREKMLKLSAKWAPYRTYACLHLWHHKDTE